MRSHAVGLIALAAIAVPEPGTARADDNELQLDREGVEALHDDSLPPHRPSAAFTLRAGSGTWSPIASRGIDEALLRARLPPLSRVMPTFDAALGGDFGPLSVELQAGGVFDAGRGGPSSVNAMRAFVVLGYRLYDELPLSIMPTVGVGTTWMSICPNQPGRGGQSRGSSFDQVLSNPSPGTCLSTGDTAVLRGGLALDVDGLFNDQGIIAGLRLRLEPAIEVPFRRSDWHGDFGEGQVELDGPLGPPIGFSLGLSVGMVIGY